MSEELTPDIVTIETLAQWMSDVAIGKWSWPANTRCKYVTLSIDTRRGAFRVEDRDGHEITEEQLLWQYGTDVPTPPSKGSDHG